MKRSGAAETGLSQLSEGKLLRHSPVREGPAPRASSKSGKRTETPPQAGPSRRRVSRCATSGRRDRCQGCNCWRYRQPADEIPSITVVHARSLSPRLDVPCRKHVPQHDNVKNSLPGALKQLPCPFHLERG